MGVIARFYVSEIAKRGYNPNLGHVKLSASTKGEQNKSWAQATPVGELTMSIGNQAALDWFEERLGRDVEIAFTDLPDGQ